MPDSVPSPALRRPILLVGRRQAAIAAAERLGLEPVVIDWKSLLRSEDQALDLRRRAVACALEALGDSLPAAVVATGEGAVPTAAHLRAHFGLRGLDPVTAAVGSDKQRMKRAVQAAGVPCARSRLVEALDPAGADASAAALIDELGLPLVLKVPVSSGGRGVKIVHDAAAAAAALAPPMLAESFVHGVEMSVETLAFEGRTLLRNHTRYLEPAWANVVPAELGVDTARAVDRLVDEALAALGVTHGMSHVELFLSPEGPVFGEVAVRPPGGHIMELIERAYGVDPWEAVLRVDLGDPPPPFPLPTRAAGAWILHPGSGRVTSVRGVEEARATPGVARVRCKAEPGSRVRARTGTGQSIGEVIVVCEGAAACASTLRAVRAMIEIDVRPPSRV